MDTAEPGTRTPLAGALLRSAIGFVLFGGALLVALTTGSASAAAASPTSSMDLCTTRSSSAPASPACCGPTDAGRERGAWLAHRRGGALLGRRRRSTGRRRSTATLRPPIPRPPTSATSPSTRWRRPVCTCWCAPAPRSSTGACGWMELIAALGTAALGAALIFEFVADRTSGSAVEVATTLAYPTRRHPDAGAGRRRRRPDPLAAGTDLVAAARRPGRAGRRRRRLHPAVDRRQPAGRRLDRTDLPARRRLRRRRGLAASAPTTIQPTRALRRLARADGPGLLRRGDDRPLRDAVLQPHQRR